MPPACQLMGSVKRKWHRNGRAWEWSMAQIPIIPLPNHSLARGLTSDPGARYRIALAMRGQWQERRHHSSGVAKAMPGQVWPFMGIGGRIPPLLGAFARRLCLSWPWPLELASCQHRSWRIFARGQAGGTDASHRDWSFLPVAEKN